MENQKITPDTVYLLSYLQANEKMTIQSNRTNNAILYENTVKLVLAMLSIMHQTTWFNKHCVWNSSEQVGKCTTIYFKLHEINRFAVVRLPIH